MRSAKALKGVQINLMMVAKCIGQNVWGGY